MIKIDRDTMEDALTKLSESSEDAAFAKSKVEGLKQKGKTKKAMAFLAADGTVAEREAKSVTSKSFEEWTEDLENAVAVSETFENTRKVDELIVRTYQTISANLRATNV